VGRGKLRLPSLVLLLSALTACSYVTDFVVVNDSGSPVEVRYVFKSRFRQDECCPHRPAKKASAKLDDEDAAWRALAPGEFSYDPAAGAVTLTLAPGEAASVFSRSGWRGHGEHGDDDSFALDSVRVAGAGGLLLYEGRQAQYQFQRQDASLYKLTYYGWGDKSYDGGR
jgi:hypothetical protein